jgi:CMP-N-acetylneuraminic acid synthetase
MDLTLEAKLSEADIKEAIKQYVASKSGMVVDAVNFQIHRGYSDMRESTPDSVTATAKLKRYKENYR